VSQRKAVSNKSGGTAASTLTLQKNLIHSCFYPAVMAGEKCDRVEAQGNMDAYLENAQGKLAERLET
jgi:hypothetical protein